MPRTCLAGCFTALLIFSTANAFALSPFALRLRAVGRMDRPALRGGAGGAKCATPAPVGDDMAAKVLSCAEAAAREAGELIKLKTGAEVTKTKASGKDLLTEIDPMCQSIIERHVKEAFPDHSFLGEENVPPGAEASAQALTQALSASDWVWVVDPIDGTTNFVHAIPCSVVSIGIAHKGTPVVGVIMDPFRDEIFTAVKGHGAFLNGVPLTGSPESTIEEAVIAAGSPPSAHNIGPSLRGIAALMPVCRTIRMFGSAALHLAWIACGRITAYFEPDLNSWDICAGAVLVGEVGGKMSGLDGSDFTLATRAMLASNGKTHDSILKVLQDANCLGPDAE